MKLERILLTTDFSELSRQAFGAAASLARKFGAEIHLVHVLETLPPLVFYSAEGVQTYSPEVDYPLKFRELLERIAREEPSLQGLRVETHLLEGAPVQERLSSFQAEQRIDLTVICTHGRTGLGYLFLGSFAEKVVRHAVSPVLTYRPREGRPAQEPFEPRRILVPYDFSRNAAAILDPVRFFADSFGAAVRFQHVLEPLPDLALIPWEGIQVEEINQRRMDAPLRARQELLELIERELPGRPQVDAVADFGVPFVEIVRAAREFEADLIVMATHGWTGLKHMLLGSVAEKVVRKTSSSVLTVRPTGLSYEHP